MLKWKKLKSKGKINIAFLIRKVIYLKMCQRNRAK